MSNYAISFESIDSFHVDICTQLDAESFSSNNFSADTIRTLVEQPNVIGLLLKLEGLPVGYSLLAHAREESDLLTICVHPASQGKGLGKELLANTLAHAKSVGVTDVFLEVRESNTAAICLYEGFGGEAVGERKNYYKDPLTGHTENAIVFNLKV